MDMRNEECFAVIKEDYGYVLVCCTYFAASLINTKGQG